MSKQTPQQAMDSIAALAQGRKIVLHVGCGAPNPEKLHKRFRGEDWFELKFDLNPAVKPHIVGDMKDMSMLPDGVIDAVWNSHTIEHLYAHEVPVALKEWARVMKPGGGILMTLPDLQSVAAHVAQGKLEDALYTSPAGPISALDVIYGYGEDIKKGVVFMAHRTGFTADTLGKKLVAAGFTDVAVSVSGFDLWAEGTRVAAGQVPSPTIRITRSDKKTETVAAPAAAAEKPPRHPGALWKGKRADELDVPPTPLKV